MRLSKDKTYHVTKYAGGKSYDMGTYNGAEVRKIIGSAKYEEIFEMFFTEKANIGYDVVEM